MGDHVLSDVSLDAQKKQGASVRAAAPASDILLTVTYERKKGEASAILHLALDQKEVPLKVYFLHRSCKIISGGPNASSLADIVHLQLHSTTAEDVEGAQRLSSGR